MIDAAVIEPLNRDGAGHRRLLPAAQTLGPSAVDAIERALLVRAA